MVATIYGLNNQTLGLDYATPVPAALSPRQSASFEFFVGGNQPIDVKQNKIPYRALE